LILKKCCINHYYKKISEGETAIRLREKYGFKSKKTEKAIRGAFYQLIQEKPIEKITVCELSKIAEINKTTFYAHYDTIYDLIDKLEQETIKSIIEHLDDCKLLFVYPQTFIKNMYTSMKLYPNIRLTLSSSNSQRFVEKLNTAVQEALKHSYINTDQYHNINTLLVFLINGIIGLQKKQNTNSINNEMDYIGKFVEGGINALGLSK
jgi:AcrR family transcriptional regulator